MTGEIVTIRCERLDEEGRGVGHAAGVDVHVIGLLPGERARVRIEHWSPHAPRAWGTLLGLESPPSPERVPPACPAHGRCGGCVLQHLVPAAQLRWKRARVEGALARHARLGAVRVLDTEPAPSQIAYRNKAKYVLARGPAGRLVYASYAPGTHEIVDMTGCRVPETPVAEVADLAVRELAPTGLPVYDERRREGELRYLVVRGNHEGRVLVVVVTRTAAPRDALGAFARRLAGRAPAVVGVVHDVNPTTGGAILGHAGVVLEGTGRLADRVGKVRLELSAGAFFQVNRAQAARLYAEACRLLGAGPGRRIVDLFSGVGGIALTAAASGARVVGVESFAAAVDDARRSAAANGLSDRASFLAADAASGLAEAARRLGGIDAVVVDPPRKGLGPAGRSALLRAAPPRIVYVSCHPDSLAEDLDALVGAGYRAHAVRPFDLMPGTAQVESITRLERESA